MTVALVLNIVLSTAVFAGVVGLLVWSIATSDRGLAGAGAQIRKPGKFELSHAPLAHPAPVRASGRRETAHAPRAAHPGQPTPSQRAAARGAVEA